jgi:glycogen synthase
MLGWELPPHNSGGLGVACFQICKELVKQDVDVTFVVPYTAEHDTPFMKIIAASPQGVKEVQKGGIAYDSVKYVYADGTEKVIGLFDQVHNYTLQVPRIVEHEEFDVIHAHDWLTFRAGLRAKELSGKPLILHVHATEFDRSGGNKGNPLVRDIEESCLLLADRVLAISELVKTTLIREYNIPAHKIEVVHNSIDITEYEQVRDENAYKYIERLKQDGHKIVVNIGRITIQKGLTNLLYAARSVVERAPKTIFLIVGSGEQLYELLELAAKLGINRNVIFTDFQRGKRLRDAFAIADLFVMPSVSEPFGLTPLEAMIYGKPSLISKQSGVAEVINHCLKVDFWDVKEMANQITLAVTQPTLLAELAKGVELELAHMSWKKSAQKMRDIYDHHSAANLQGVFA